MSDKRVQIRKLDENLKGLGAIVQKSARISKSDAEEFLALYADGERAANPSLSAEQAFSKAMLECPRLGGIAVGNSQEVVQAWNS